MAWINGSHMENKGFSWHWERELQMVGNEGCVTMLDTLLTDVENEYWYPRLVRDFPNIKIQIRMYPETGWVDPTFGRHWNDLDPTIWARECYRRLTSVPNIPLEEQPIFNPNVVISFANEQDLANEGHPNAATVDQPHIEKWVYDQIWHWNTVVIKSFKALSIGKEGKSTIKCKIGSSPLAGGHDVIGYPPDYEYQLDTFKAYIKLCDVFNIHAYFYTDGNGTNPDNSGYWVGIRALRPKGYRENVQGYEPINGIPDPGGALSQWGWAIPIWIKEFGNFRHYDQTAEGIDITITGYNEIYSAFAATQKCIGITPFIWNCGDEHSDNRLFGNWELVQRLTDMPRYTACGFYNNFGGDPVSDFKFELGFKELADSNPLMIGKPTSNMMSDGYGNVFQYTTTGKLEWNKISNQMFFFQSKAGN